MSRLCPASLVAAVVACGGSSLAPADSTDTGSSTAFASTDGGVKYDVGASDRPWYQLVARSSLDPERPLQFLLRAEIDGDSVALQMRPLAVAPGSMLPGDEVGDVLLPSASGGEPLAFTAEFRDLTLPAAANPLTEGSIAGEYLLVVGAIDPAKKCTCGDGLATFDLAGLHTMSSLEIQIVHLADADERLDAATLGDCSDEAC